MMTRRRFFRLLPPAPLALVSGQKPALPIVAPDETIGRRHWDQLIEALEDR